MSSHMERGSGVVLNSPRTVLSPEGGPAASTTSSVSGGCTSSMVLHKSAVVQQKTSLCLCCNQGEGMSGASVEGFRHLLLTGCW